MKKQFRLFLVILSLLVAVSVFAACQFGTVTITGEQFSAILAEADQAEAVDMSMDMTLTVGSDVVVVTMQIIVSESEETAYVELNMNYNQTMFVYGSFVTKPVQETTKMYYYDGHVYTEQNDNLEVYEAGIGEIVGDYDESPATLFGDVPEITVKKSRDKNLDKYAMELDSLQLDGLIGSMLDGMMEEMFDKTDVNDIDFDGTFCMTVWIERKTNTLNKIDYVIEFKTGGKNCKIELCAVVNALDDDVEINIPTNVQNEISKYKKYPKLTLSKNIDGAGTISKEGRYPRGDSVRISSNINNGYHFVGWYIDGKLVSENSYYSFEMPARDLEIVAVYAFRIYLAAEPYSYGAVTFYNSKSKWIYCAFEGDIVSAAANPYHDYVFYGWYEGDVCVSEDAIYKFEMPAYPRKLVAKFGERIE